MIGVEPGVRGHFPEHGQVGFGRHDDDRLDRRRHGVLGQGIAGIPLSRTANRVKPSDRAIETVMAIPRSLKERVGLAPKPA